MIYNLLEIETKKPTICKECRHLKLKPDDRASCRFIWYNMLCKKSERAAGFDPCTGEPGYMAENSLGTRYVTDEPFGYCRDKNIDGRCPDFI